MDNRYKKLGKNTLLMIIGSFSSKLLSFFLVPLYTYYLSTSDYGTVDLISTTVQLLVPVLTLVATETIIRFTLDNKVEKNQVLSVSFYISLIGFTILLLFSPIIYKLAPFRDYYPFFIILYVVTVIATSLQQFTKGLNHVSTYVFSGVLQTIITLSLNIVFLVLCGYGFQGYLIATIIGYFCSIGLIIIKERIWKYVLPIQKTDKSLWKQYFSFAIPLLPNSISWWISNSSDKYIIQLFHNISLNGIYAVSYKIPSILTTVSTIFTSAWQISAVDNFGSEESKRFISDLYDKYSSFYVITCSIVVFFTQIAARVLFSKDFYNAWPYSVILTCAAMFQGLSGFLGVIYTTAKKNKMVFVSTMVGAIGNIIINFLLIPKYGAYGAAIATLISYILVWLIRLIDTRNIIPYRINSTKIVFSYLILGIMALITCFNNPFRYIVGAFCIICQCIINKTIVMGIIRLIKTKIDSLRG